MSDLLTILHGDALSQLRQLPSASVQCCVTSPPYWGLRDYGLEPIVWEPESVPEAVATGSCKHKWGEWRERHDEREKRSHGKTRKTDRFYGDKSRRFNGNHQKHTAGSFCVKCGAWRGCLGLEPTIDLYVDHLVQIFREVKRILRPDGTVWLNLGDTYAGGGNGGGGSFAKDGIRAAKPGTDKNIASRVGSRGVTVKSKRIPRGEGRWGGGNVSVRQSFRRDRRDVGDVRHKNTPGIKAKDLIGVPWRVAFALQADGWYLRRDIVWAKPNPMPESVIDRPTTSHEYIFLLAQSSRYYYNGDAIKEPIASGPSDIRKMEQQLDRIGGKTLYATDPLYKANSSTNIGKKRIVGNPSGRNARSVWTISTQPFPEAHFAVFPSEIPRRCILTGCMGGGTVLDPFAGSGTTGRVAIELGRRAILIEPKKEYIEMIKRRCRTNIGLPIVSEPRAVATGIRRSSA